MKKGLLLIAAIIFIAFNSNAQVVSEDFESTPGDQSDISIAGWVNYATEGTRMWQSREYVSESNKYTQLSAYNSTDATNVAWLITPSFTLGSTNVLTFRSKTGYYKHDALTVFISTDFDGNEANIGTANWTELTYTKPTGPVDSYGDWTPSGDVSLTGSGTAYIGFKYSGNAGAGETTTLQLDDIVVNVTSSVDNITISTKLFPNPASSVLNIKSEANISNITVSNVIGQRVLTVNSINSNNYKLNVENLNNGVYLININNVDGTSGVAKFVKK